jgi:hypothetical protein
LTMLDETQVLRTSPEEPAGNRGGWYLLTGLVLGLILGLVYAWVIDPVVYENTLPGDLAAEHKDTYCCMIAQAYAATGNLERAALRLDILDDEDPYYALGAQAQCALAEGRSEEARALALLASAIKSYQADSEDLLSTPPLPTATQNILPTYTLPIATSTP